MFARGVGQQHWDEVMKNQKSHIQKWHKLQDIVGPSESSHNNLLDVIGPRSRRGSSSLAPPDFGPNKGGRQRSASVCMLAMGKK